MSLQGRGDELICVTLTYGKDEIVPIRGIQGVQVRLTDTVWTTEVAKVVGDVMREAEKMRHKGTIQIPKCIVAMTTIVPTLDDDKSLKRRISVRRDSYRALKKDMVWDDDHLEKMLRIEERIAAHKPLPRIEVQLDYDAVVSWLNKQGINDVY